MVCNFSSLNFFGICATLRKSAVDGISSFGVIIRQNLLYRASNKVFSFCVVLKPSLCCNKIIYYLNADVKIEFQSLSETI